MKFSLRFNLVFIILLYSGLTLARLSPEAVSGDVSYQPEHRYKFSFSEDHERKERLKNCKAQNDFQCILDESTPSELGELLGNKLRAPRSARFLTNREAMNFTSAFDVHITVDLNARPQHLIVQHPYGPDQKIIVSGGKGNSSDLIMGDCFVPHWAPKVAYSKKYGNAKMGTPLFIRGRQRRRENPQGTGNVYALHSSNKVTGGPESKGCIRMKPKDSKWVQDIAKYYGLSRTVICIKPKS